MLEAEQGRLARAAFVSLVCHLAAGLAMAFILARGLATNPDLADRLRFLDEQRWLWRAGWSSWSLAAASVLYFFWALVEAHREDPTASAPLLRRAVPLTVAAVACDLSAQAIYLWLVPGAPAKALLAWDRRAVLLTGLLANGLYTTAAGLLAWACRASYPRWTGAAAALVVAGGAWLSAAAWADSVPGMFWSNILLVPALLAWQAGVGLTALRRGGRSAQWHFGFPMPKKLVPKGFVPPR